MKKRLIKLIVLACLALALAVPTLMLLCRPPVLVVSDFSLVSLYGPMRVRVENALSSLALYRPVKPVIIADDAGDDILIIALAKASSRPFCVIFSLRFASAAKQYREQYPEVPVVLLEGRYPAGGANPASFAISNNETDDYFIFTTDIDVDFYRAGLAAAVLDGEKNGNVSVFTETRVQAAARDAFTRALKEREKTMKPLFNTSISQLNNDSEMSCAVIAGPGIEFFDINSDTPVIFFTWLYPAVLADNAIVVFDDSPWVQAVPAARMAAARVMKGEIPSKPLVLPSKYADKDTLQQLGKLAGFRRLLPIFGKNGG
jgi:hypothetical protein